MPSPKHGTTSNTAIVPVKNESFTPTLEEFSKVVALKEEVLSPNITLVDEDDIDETVILDGDDDSALWNEEDVKQLPDSVRLYLSEIGKQPRLTPEEEISLAKEIEKPELLKAEALVEQSETRKERLARMIERAEVKAARARERFVNANLRLVVHYAYWYADRGVDLLDLFQEGNVGLIRAVEKYDWRTGFRFSTYATWWIQQSLRKTVQSQKQSIRLPVHANEELNSIITAENQLAQELQRLPREQEVSERVGLPTKRIAHLKAITKPVTGIDEVIDGREGEGDITYGDTISNDDHIQTEENISLDILRGGILSALRNLTVRESLVVILRNGLLNGHPLTLAQTGDEIGVSREMARQIEIKAFAKLKENMSLRLLITDNEDEKIPEEE